MQIAYVRNDDTTLSFFKVGNKCKTGGGASGFAFPTYLFFL